MVIEQSITWLCFIIAWHQTLWGVILSYLTFCPLSDYSVKELYSNVNTE